MDILKTALVLQDNYEFFRKEVGFDFHPLDAVLQMPESRSKFWEKIRSSDNRFMLWGLLFGYGKFNASIYNWKYQDAPESCRKFLLNLPFHYSNPDPIGLVKISINNFELPSFISFDPENEIIAKYEHERKKIKAICKSHNFLDSALEELSSTSLNIEEK